MLTSIKQRLDREDEGFTLIELMVVLLIIAILLAIAIPTFLGARDTANARGTQENLRNALTAEQSYWTNNQTFTLDASSIEPSLKWETGAPVKGAADVLATTWNFAAAGDTQVTSTTATSDSVMLEGYAKDDNCYAIFATNNGTTSFTAYYSDSLTASGSTCASITPPTAKPTAAHASGSGNTGTWALAF